MQKPLTGSVNSAYKTPDFRTTLGHFASGIVIIAARHEGRPVGLSIQSFASLSLDPPLVSLSVSVTSATWPAIAEEGRFCASILSADQEELSRRYRGAAGARPAARPR